MLVKTIIDNEIGKKYEIYKNGENDYSYKYYEFFTSCGWILVSEEKHYLKDAIEFDFDIKVA